MSSVAPPAHESAGSAAAIDTDTKEDDSIRITVTLPDGWAGIDDTAIWLPVEHNSGPAGASLLFGRGAWLYSDPCATPPPPDDQGARRTDLDGRGRRRGVGHELRRPHLLAAAAVITHMRAAQATVGR